MPTHVLYGNQPFETHKVYIEAAAVLKKRPSGLSTIPFYFLSLLLGDELISWLLMQERRRTDC
jgi:hypothetical protein